MSRKSIDGVVRAFKERGYDTRVRYEKENSKMYGSRWIYTIIISKETENRRLSRIISVQSVNYPRFPQNTVMAFTGDSSIERIVNNACFENTNFPSGPWDFSFPK